MSKVAVMMSAQSAEGPMSSHFGKAEWIMIADTENASLDFVKNDAMNGRGAAGTVIGEGCTDVLVVDIGGGALGHLQEARIQAWAVGEPVAGAEALRRFKAGQLPAVSATQATEKHGGGQGCCCGHGGAGSSCCRG
jgi:predicted Fe-Mo cluster-binding NifX family protein